MSLWSTETTRGIALATYSNPPMSYFTAEGTRELMQLISEWADPAIRAVVLTGGVAGKFITHYSVEELLTMAQNRDVLRAVGPSISMGYHALLQQLRDLPKPIIVAMNGDTMGGGFELSLACDIRIGQRGDYRYGLPEVKLGILPGGSGTQRLARLIGPGRAIEFVLRARIVRPEDALALGLIHELADDARTRALGLAQELAGMPPTAVAQAKRAVYEGGNLDLAAGLNLESAAFYETMLSDDALRLMEAYVATPLDQRRDWIERQGRPT